LLKIETASIFGTSCSHHFKVISGRPATRVGQSGNWPPKIFEKVCIW